MTLSALARDDFDGLGKLSREHGVTDLQKILAELAWRKASRLKDAADGAAGDATAEIPFHHVTDYTQKMAEAWYIPAAALTGHDTANATLKVRRRKKDGADGDVLFQVTTTIANGNWVAHKPVSIPKLAATLAASFTLADGESLTFEITKAGAGVVVPAGVLVVFFS